MGMEKDQEGIEAIVKLISVLNKSYNLPNAQIKEGIRKVEKSMEEFRVDVPKADEIFEDLLKRLVSVGIDI